MEETKTIIRRGRERLGMTEQQFADCCGVSRGSIQQWEKGLTAPKRGNQAAVAQVLGISVAELMGQGPQNPGLRLIDGGANTPSQNDGSLTIIKIPQHNSGGMVNGTTSLVLRNQPGVICSMQVTREWLDKNAHNYTAAGNLTLVTGFGDSMRGMYEPGDPLLVDTGVRTVEYDGVYFFRVADEGFVKRLQRIPGDGMLVISENKAYRDWMIKPEMDFEVLGRVLKAWVGTDY